MIPSSRRKPGEVRDAIVGYLFECGREATLAEIRHAVAERLRGELSESSIRSYLRINTPGQFEQPAPGKYRIKPTADDQGALTFETAHQPSATSYRSFCFKHATLWCADSLEWLHAQPEQSIHAIVTDPPYGLLEYSMAQQEKLRSGKGGVWRLPPSFDGHQRSPLPRFTVLDECHLAELKRFFSDWARRCYRVLVPGAHIVVASNPLLSHRLSMAISDAGFERRGEVIRLVMTMRGGDRPKNAHHEFQGVSAMPRSMFEPWLLFRKPLDGRLQDNLRKWKTGGLRRPTASKPFGDVIESHPTRPAEREIADHPSLKPQAFLRQLVRAMLPLGEGTILDCFAGSGSTLAAAEAVGYRSVGIEKDPLYFELAENAIPKLMALRVPSSP